MFYVFIISILIKYLITMVYVSDNLGKWILIWSIYVINKGHL